MNAWNRNVLPWWLLLPQGVPGAIKRRAGCAPFHELSKKGILPLGAAVQTTAGRLPFKAIIHVAGINLLWRATEDSIRLSVRNALQLAKQAGYGSIAFPLIGGGTGGKAASRVKEIISDATRENDFAGEVRIVRFRK